MRKEAFFALQTRLLFIGICNCLKISALLLCFLYPSVFVERVVACHGDADEDGEDGSR